MSEYLERETVVNIADHAILEHPYDKDSRRPETYSDYNQGWSDACNHIRARLEYVPAADVAPVRHGKWKEWDGDAFVGMNKFGKEIYRHFRYYTCSLCYKGSAIKSNYCPNCGARMDGEESNDGTILQNDRNRL